MNSACEFCGKEVSDETTNRFEGDNLPCIVLKGKYGRTTVASGKDWPQKCIEASEGNCKGMNIYNKIVDSPDHPDDADILANLK